jgi:hypothetical protein
VPGERRQRPAVPAGSAGKRRATENDVEEYLKLKRLVEDVGDDVYKAVGGNKAAGTRVRKAMQDIKNAAQEVRKRVLDMREGQESGQPAAEPSDQS